MAEALDSAEVHDGISHEQVGLFDHVLRVFEASLGDLCAVEHGSKLEGEQDQRTKCHGPIHLVGVHKGVTEQQVLSTLGQPDAVLIVGSFGIYVADKVQNIQLVFLANCRDGSSTAHNVQRFIDWLSESGESDDFFLRSIKRRNIIDAVIKQI